MIKKSLITFVLLIAATLYCSAQGIGVVIVDKDGPFTNIRNAPNGKIVKKISTDKTVGLVVTSPKNGWWRIVGDSYEDYDIGDPSEEVKLTGSKSGYWIHYSCIGFFTRNYGGQRITLRSAPSSKAKAVYSFTTEETPLLMDKKGSWLKVKIGTHIGWMEDEWWCDNPLTNCC